MILRSIHSMRRGCSLLEVTVESERSLWLKVVGTKSARRPRHWKVCFRMVSTKKATDPRVCADLNDLADSMDKIVELAHHPALADVLLSASEDHGQHNLRLWDVSKGSVLSKIAVPGKGVSCSTFRFQASLHNFRLNVILLL